MKITIPFKIKTFDVIHFYYEHESFTNSDHSIHTFAANAASPPVWVSLLEILSEAAVTAAAASLL